MKPKLLSSMLAGLAALGVIAGLSAPAGAGPTGYVAPHAAATAGPDAAANESVILADGRKSWNGKRWIYKNGNRGNSNGGRGWQSGNFHDGGIYRGNDYRQQKNYWKYGKGRYPKRNYRRYDNNYWGVYPGFYLGLGVPAYPYAQRRVYRLDADHVAWCYDRWRSYRASDNTYQPLRGPRRQCISPYG